MTLDIVTKLIRRENVALWIGAGFSLYAGYPSGKKLGDILKKELSTDEQQQISENASLRQIASALITFRNQSRNELNHVLSREFGRKPSATHNHDLLSRIPHFKEIITTNYDSLIETSYAGRGHVVRKDIDVPYIPNNHPVIYKIHGDLESKENIIITDNDYTKFISHLRPEQPIWTAVRNILAKKVVLFLGYSFEDENLWAWLDTIDSSLGDNRKERYLIAPNWPAFKIMQLQERHVSYIDCSAEDFLTKLHCELKLNIVSDLENGLISIDTFNSYVSFHEYDSNIISESGKAKVSSIHKKGKATSNIVNFTVKEDAARKIQSFAKGYGKTLKIDNSQLINFEHFVDEFKMNSNAQTVQSLHIVRIPLRYHFRIEMPEDEIDIDNVIVEIVQVAESKFEAKCDIYGFDLTLTITEGKKGWQIDFNTNSPKTFPPTYKLILFIKAMINYSLGKKTLLHINGSVLNVSGFLIKSDISLFEKMLTFYKRIKVIENYFTISFEGQEADHSPSKQNIVDKICNLIQNEFMTIPVDDLKILSVDSERELEQISIEENPNIQLNTNRDEVVNLFGKEINLGQCSVEVEDVTEIIYSDDKKSAKLKNLSGIAIKRYSNIPN